MANASMKWNEHVQDILRGVQKDVKGMAKAEEEDEMAEQGANEEEDEIEVP
jgi:hypothetical protein